MDGKAGFVALDDALRAILIAYDIAFIDVLASGVCFSNTLHKFDVIGGPEVARCIVLACLKIYVGLPGDFYAPNFRMQFNGDDLRHFA